MEADLEGPSRDPEDLAGEVIDHFQIIGVVGRGGMGVVLRARDLLLDRPVALKMLAEELVRLPERRRALAQEARAAARAGCPEVATVYEAHLDGPRPYLAMELIEGESLREALRRGPLPAGRVLAIGRGVARALATMHARGVLHRDLKPENVMIAHDGAVKVLDFGVARLVLDAAQPLTPTPEQLARQSGTTSAYAAPELLEGGIVDARADVFAFGVMLAELLTGSPRRVAPSADELAALGGAALSTLLQGCLAPSPTRRLDDGLALLAAMDGLIGASTVGHSRRCPAPFPDGADDAAALLDAALAQAAAQEAGFLGLEHLVAALRDHVGGGPRTHRLRVALTGVEELWAPGAFQPGVPPSAPAPTPRLRALAGRLAAGFSLEMLATLICDDRGHHLHLIGRLPLVVSAADPRDQWATVSDLEAGKAEVATPARALQVLRGPEDGRVIAPEPGEELGRWSPDGAAPHALYAGTLLQDPTLSRRAATWLGGGRILLHRPGRLARGPVREPVAAAELSLRAGDVLMLSRGTWLRALSAADAAMGEGR